jgi:hypothetical protein
MGWPRVSCPALIPEAPIGSIKKDSTKPELSDVVAYWTQTASWGFVNRNDFWGFKKNTHLLYENVKTYYYVLIPGRYVTQRI